MNGICVRSVGLGVLVVAMASFGLGESHASKPSRAAIPLPTDWSHQHLIFSQPRTPEAAARVQRDVRYAQEQQRHELRPTATLDKGDPLKAAKASRRHHRRGLRMHRDWSWDLGPGAKTGPGMYPAKFSFDATVAQCVGSAQPDFVVFGTSVPGSLTQGSIVALTNLYSGCAGQTPGYYWRYDTSGTVHTSPVLSIDGTQLAFTQTSGGTASLVLLKWSAFDGIAAPLPLISVSPSAYAACTGVACMTTFPLGSSDDTNSSVFYDYATDTAWVGDDAGVLHQFTGVFKGTAAEVTTGWPITVSGGSPLTSPVHISGTSTSFVGDKAGFLYSVTDAGVITKSAQLDFGTGLTQGPIVDGSVGSIYVFSSRDAVGSAGVFQFAMGFGAGTAGTEATVGTGTTVAGTTPLYNGAFDHNYINGAAPTGNLYLCGDPGGRPTIYQVPILSNVMGTPIAGPVIGTTTTTPCSPVTDVYNATVTGAGLPQEWVFASVQGAGTPTPCGGFSCVMNFKVTAWQPNFQYNLGQEVLDSNLNIEVCDNSGGTSGPTPPAWSTLGIHSPTTDGTVHWRVQGPLSAQSPGIWQANFAFPGAFQIVDSNNNIETAIPSGGTSGSTMPVWPTTEGGTVVDGTITWVNLGANPVAALQAQGGTSGIIIDNTVINPGGSQVYYSTQQDSNCFTSGGVGGCAVQASQQGLN